MPRFTRRLTAAQRESFEMLRALLSAAAYEDRSKLPRELKLLSDLRARYPDPAFWQQLKPAIPLDTLLEFKSASGARMIQIQWDNYQRDRKLRAAIEETDFERAVNQLERTLSDAEQIELDKAAKPNTVGSNSLPKRKLTVAQWADS